MYRCRALLAFLAFLFLAASALSTTPASAAWGIDGVSLVAPASTQSGSVLVSDGAGGAIVAWLDSRGGAFPAVFVQRLSPTGAALWGANGFQISIVGRNNQDVAITTDGAGGAIVTWAGTGSFDDFDIYAQRVLPNGSVSWAAGGLDICNVGNFTTGLSQVKPTICADGAGGAFVAWDDGRAGLGTHDIYAQHITGLGTALWTINGVAVCTLTSSQTLPAIASGAAGSAVVAWLDARNANQDVFAQRLNDPSGAGAWTANGVAVCNAANSQSDLRVVPDGAGAFAAWTDERAGAAVYDVFLQRIAAADGSSLWAANGVGVSPSTSGTRRRPALVNSGTGVLVAWEDQRAGNADIYSQRFDLNGAALWPAGGVAMATASNAQEFPIGLADGSGGAFVAWRDTRISDSATTGRAGHVDASGSLLWGLNGIATKSTTTPTTLRSLASDGSGGLLVGFEGAAAADAFAQRVMANSNLADYDAVISSVKDVYADEGGQVRITLGAAIGDYAPSSPYVTGYTVWHQIPPGAGPAPSIAGAGSARELGLAALASAERGTRLDAEASLAVGFPAGSWESMGSTGAIGSGTYYLVASTPTDSTNLGPADQSYVVTVQTSAGPSLYAVTNTGVGHSVDNLAPVAPLNLAGTLVGAGTVKLDWGASTAADLAYYAVYRGDSPAFLPNPASRIATPTSPTYTDPGFADSYYKVSAVDRHGNQSPFVLLTLAQISGVDSPPVPGVSSLAGPRPNPFAGESDLGVALAAPGRVTLRVYDVRGRLIRTLEDEERPAGIHHVTWNGVDDRGRRVGAGVYLVRATAPGLAATQRLVIGR